MVLHDAYGAPWAIDVPSAAELRPLLGAAPDVHVVPFHLVREGAFELRVAGAGNHPVGHREVAICAGGQAHRMQRGEPMTACSLASILAGSGPAPAAGDSGARTMLVCGVFMLRATPTNPLLLALPAVMTLPTDDEASAPMLVHATEMLMLELQRTDLANGSFAAARILELFCAEALRAYQAEAVDRVGWFGGLADPKVGQALALVHADPGHRWSVPVLAGRVALSPSRFAARFRERVGESVGAYLTRWRMTVACRLLTDTEDSIAGIAERSGYGAVSSFTRAFSASLGIPPAEWRRRARRSSAPL